MGDVPPIRVRQVNDAPLAPMADYVLYWMTAARRTRYNFALDRAVDWAQSLGRPLVVFEALRAGYRWASDRLHRFVIEGMRDNQERLSTTPALYYPYVEPTVDADKGLLATLAERSCLVVTDEFPAFFLPRMLAAAGRRIAVRLEAVDSNGLLPLAATDQVFTTAYQFRRYLQKHLPDSLCDAPAADPVRKARLPPAKPLPASITRRWPTAKLDKLLRTGGLSRLPIDHAVPPASFAGGGVAARKALTGFLKHKLPRYLDERNEPELDATSGLSPYLHFGHVSAHEVFARLVSREGWTPARLSKKTAGKREDWWDMSPAAEAFLDQLVTWRELGYNMAHHCENYDRYESLPEWAQRTLAQHAADPRPVVYSLDEFEQARTHDRLWNAAQGQLVREGRLHNYLRMLWGKKILEWSASPREALEVLIELNNKYAVDGRDPNSYAGIFWTLGRYDRPWGPERAIFGKVRYMSSRNTARKIAVDRYIDKFAPASS